VEKGSPAAATAAVSLKRDDHRRSSRMGPRTLWVEGSLASFSAVHTANFTGGNPHNCMMDACMGPDTC
jgi:hypothetical protein